jgi:hypothetical protein
MTTSVAKIYKKIDRGIELTEQEKKLKDTFWRVEK